MPILVLLSIAFRSLLANKLRSFLAVLGIMFAAAFLIPFGVFAAAFGAF